MCAPSKHCRFTALRLAAERSVSPEATCIPSLFIYIDDLVLAAPFLLLIDLPVTYPFLIPPYLESCPTESQQKKSPTQLTPSMDRTKRRSPSTRLPNVFKAASIPSRTLRALNSTRKSGRRVLVRNPTRGGRRRLEKTCTGTGISRLSRPVLSRMVIRSGCECLLDVGPISLLRTDV